MMCKLCTECSKRYQCRTNTYDTEIDIKINDWKTHFTPPLNVYMKAQIL